MPRNADLCPITLLNKHKARAETWSSGIYIGRGSSLGNQWSHMDGTKAAFKTATREEAIEAYELWLKGMIADENPEVCKALNHIYDEAMQRPTALSCFCHPLPCHGDVIIKVVKEAHACLQNQKAKEKS
jgi:hypothetical protein